MRLIASVLRDVGAGPREAFILYAIEGFGVDEIAAITGAPPPRFWSPSRPREITCAKRPGFAREFQGRLAPTGAA